jgi:hypothetical protein
VDLDGDGIPDILSGSWPGELYLFRGQGKGNYAKGEILKDKDGKPIKVGSASTVFAFDWDGDGKLDLLVGCIEGHVYLIPNEGTRDQYAFGKPRKLSAAGQEILVPHGDSHPVAADWDRDGKPDLLVGTGAGSVLLYRNVGTRQEPKLAAAQTLVAESPSMRQHDKPLKEGEWGARAKICVVDWNGDGWPDLLVGDFSMAYGEKPKMTDADKAVEKEANAKQAEIWPKYREAVTKFQALQKAPPGETAEAKKERLKKAEELKSQIDERQKEMNAALEPLLKFQRPYSFHGNVWLFLRKPPEAAAARP